MPFPRALVGLDSIVGAVLMKCPVTFLKCQQNPGFSGGVREGRATPYPSPPRLSNHATPKGFGLDRDCVGKSAT